MRFFAFAFILALACPGLAVAPDGEGSARFVAPTDPVVEGAWKADMVFTVGKSGMAYGGGIKFYTPPTCWKPPLVDDQHVRLVTTSGAKAKLSIETRQVLGWIVTVTIHGGKLDPGDQIIYTYDCAEVQKYTQKGLICRVDSDATGDGRFAQIDDDKQPAVNVVSGPPAQIRLAAQQIVKPGQRVIIKSIVMDALRNPLDVDYNGVIEVGFIGSEAKQRYEHGRASFSLTAPDKPGIYHIHARAAGLKDEYLPVKVTDQDDPNIYWGQLHGHTGFSDGVETPTDYYAYGRDIGMLDFAAVNDHAEGQSVDNKWLRSLAATREFYKPGEFVTLAGYEWTAHGHRNVYFAEAGDDTPLFWGRDETTPTYQDLARKLKASGKEAITGYHTAHPTDLANYDPDVHRIVELHSMWGTTEYPGNRGWTKTREPYIPMSCAQSALARGQKLGFVGGGDSHHGRPGRFWMGSRWNILAHKEGAAAVLAPKLERRDVFDALKNCHTYATTGERILLVFKANGHGMGDEFETDGPVTIHFEVGATSELSQVDIVRDNVDIWSKFVTGLKFDGEIKDESLTPGNHYYYLRVTQKSGDRAWSSPIWVNRRQTHSPSLRRRGLGGG